MKVDSIDRKILNILQKNAKITNAKLSNEIGLSPAPTLERVRKLETSGIISGYHAKLDNSKIGLNVSTYVMVSLKSHNKKNLDLFIDKIKNVENIVECHHITGSGDFILKVVAKDIESYQKLMLEKVSEIESTDSLQSMVILSTFKDNKVMPL
ncbi:MAG: Lrp/AsnC family transcriptional regulator [Flammeovirgaceae bacterium TMED290]|nr:MAG: Lrp/AsnC family transcriptional regulator [Flammeovirgaceae bacterium TMED290]|tara:strand:+ start:3306 stop:3764 length:459 start_codon:yes stop_codon:yes gene_type:complete